MARLWTTYEDLPNLFGIPSFPAGLPTKGSLFEHCQVLSCDEPTRRLATDVERSRTCIHTRRYIGAVA